MKTLLLAPELFTTDSGIPRILRLYLKALCDNARPDDRVGFVALNDSAPSREQLAAYTTPAALGEHVGCARAKLRFTLTALRHARNADLLLCGHVAQLPVAWLARILNPRLRYVLIAHGIEVWRPFSFAERLALRAARRVLCVSAFTRGEILRHLPRLAQERLVVLPNALDPHLRAAPVVQKTPASPVILTVSRLSRSDSYKGVDHLIAALPAIRSRVPETTLRVVGRGDDLPRLRDLARSRGVEHAVSFAGYVDDARLVDEFTACSVFALPSQKEGFGLVYVEAMAHGKPCVAARAGGAPEVVTTESGVLAPYGDVSALAEACVHALTTKWDAAAIRACAERFSYPVFRSQLARLIAA